VRVCRARHASGVKKSLNEPLAVFNQSWFLDTMRSDEHCHFFVPISEENMQSHNRHLRQRLGGAAFCAGLILAAGSASAATTYGVLYAFGEGPNGVGPNGAYPKAGLISDSSGNLYGTAQFGGAGTNCMGGCGTIFKLSPSGALALLHSFAGGTADGQEPSSELVADSSGNLYGTAPAGGASNAGVVFKLAPDGTNYTVLHSFAGGVSDGARPNGDLIIDSLGNLYGTTLQGGPSGAGVVFELATDGTRDATVQLCGQQRWSFPVRWPLCR
jgi:uncharacterized repeat protein (TIGR03803 family)